MPTDRRDFLAAGAGLVALATSGCTALTDGASSQQHDNDTQLMGTRTPNLGLYKPGTGEGTPKRPVSDELNGNWDKLDTAASGGSGYDTTVTSTSELIDAFANLSRGEGVFLAQPATPYEPAGWLDIDVSGVTITAENQFAENGEPIITMAAGSNSGGIRVGHTSPVENILIEGIGYDGNYQNTGNGPYHHAITFNDVERGRITRCYAQHIGLHHVHAVGGSGISVHHNCQYITIDNNHIHDTGDRGIQCAGTNVQIVNNRTTDGFDRSISLSLQEPDANGFSASNVLVANNIGYNNIEGSIIGMARGEDNQPFRNIRVVNNIGYGAHRALVRLRPGVDVNADREGIVITGNVGRGGGASGISFNNNKGRLRHVVVANNKLTNYGDKGIAARNVLDGVAITGNYIKNPTNDGIQTNADVVTVTSNVIDGAGGNGIYCTGGSATITANRVTGVGRTGIDVTNSNGQRNVVSNNVDDSAVGIHIGGNYAACGFNTVSNITYTEIELVGDYNTIIGNIAEGTIEQAGANSEKVANIEY